MDTVNIVQLVDKYTKVIGKMGSRMELEQKYGQMEQLLRVFTKMGKNRDMDS